MAKIELMQEHSKSFAIELKIDFIIIAQNMCIYMYKNVWR